MEYRICVNCVKEEKLKRYMFENGETEKCFFCNNVDISINFENDHRFRQLVKALIRYHYDGEYFSGKYGLQDADDLLISENVLIDVNKNKLRSDDDKINALNILVGSYYEEFKNGVSLALGDRYHMGPAIRKLEDHFLKDLENELEYRNFYHYEKVIINRLKKLLDKVCSNIKLKPYYRARVGCEKSCILFIDIDEWEQHKDYEENPKKYEYFLPYSDSHLSAPKPQVSNEGRMNRKGVSFLYLASDIETAISEMRGSKGHIISVGEFVCNERLKIIDFSEIDFYNFYKSDKEIEDYIFLNHIINIFSLPNPERNYVVTQCISEALVWLGVDGIKYRSSLSNSNGHNLVMFDLRKFQYIENSSRVYEVKSVRYDYTLRNSNIDEEKFYVFKDKNGFMPDEGRAFLEKFRSPKY